MTTERKTPRRVRSVAERIAMLDRAIETHLSRVREARSRRAALIERLEAEAKATLEAVQKSKESAE